MRPILLLLALMVYFIMIACGLYMRYKQDRKTHGRVFIIAGILGIAVILTYHFFFT